MTCCGRNTLASEIRAATGETRVMRSDENASRLEISRFGPASSATLLPSTFQLTEVQVPRSFCFAGILRYLPFWYSASITNSAYARARPSGSLSRPWTPNPANDAGLQGNVKCASPTSARFSAETSTVVTVRPCGRRKVHRAAISDPPAAHCGDRSRASTHCQCNCV